MISDELLSEVNLYNREITRLREEQHKVTDRLYDFLKDEIYADNPNVELLKWLDDHITDGFVEMEVRRRIRLLRKQGRLE